MVNNIFHANFKLSVLLTRDKGLQKITVNSQEDARFVIRKKEKRWRDFAAGAEPCLSLPARRSGTLPLSYHRFV